MRRTGSLKLFPREADGWTTTLNCSNTVLPVFVNTGLLILRKTGSLFTIESEDTGDYTFSEAIKAGIYDDLEIDFSSIDI